MHDKQRLTDLLFKANKILLAKRWTARIAQSKENAMYTHYCTVKNLELNAPIKTIAKLQKYIDDNKDYL